MSRSIQEGGPSTFQRSLDVTGVSRELMTAGQSECQFLPRDNCRVGRRSAQNSADFLVRRQAGGKQDFRRALPEPVGSPPEYIPGLTRTPADEYVSVISDGDVLD